MRPCPYAKQEQFFRCKLLSLWSSPPLEDDGALQSVQSVVPVGPSDPRPVPPLRHETEKLFTSGRSSSIQLPPSPKILKYVVLLTTDFWKNDWTFSLLHIFSSKIYLDIDQACMILDCCKFYRFRSILHSFFTSQDVTLMPHWVASRCPHLAASLQPTHLPPRTGIPSTSKRHFEKKIKTYSNMWKQKTSWYEELFRKW